VRIGPSESIFGDGLRSGREDLGGDEGIGAGYSSRDEPEQRVIYVYAIKKVVSYVYAMENFPSTCMPRTRSLLTYMPFWMDGELTEVLEGV
jgi:hypothetical protein